MKAKSMPSPRGTNRAGLYLPHGFPATRNPTMAMDAEIESSSGSAEIDLGSAMAVLQRVLPDEVFSQVKALIGTITAEDEEFGIKNPNDIKGGKSPLDQKANPAMDSRLRPGGAAQRNPDAARVRVL